MLNMHEETIAELAARDAYAALVELRRRASDQEHHLDFRLMAKAQLRRFESAMDRSSGD